MVKFLTSDYMILLTLLGVGWYIIRPHFWVVRRMWNDDVAWARTASRVSLAILGLFLVWTTVVDNWRQMLGFLVDEKNRWKSDLYGSDPPPDAARFVTFVLVGLSVLAAAYLYARYARGYFIPIIATPIGLIMFYALNGFRMKYDLVGSLWEGGIPWSDPAGVAATFAWFGVEQVVMFTLILSAFMLLWGPTAIVFSLIYRRTIGREIIDEPAMYRILRERRIAGEGRDAKG